MKIQDFYEACPDYFLDFLSKWIYADIGIGFRDPVFIFREGKREKKI